MVKSGISSMSQAPAYLMQGIENTIITKHWNFDNQQIKSLLALIVKDIVSKETVDQTIQEQCISWKDRGDDQEKELIAKTFGSNGTKLLQAMDQNDSVAHYMIISALFNSKQKKEDVKVFSFAQVVQHLHAKNLLVPEVSCALGRYSYVESEIILLLKLFLEQDLLTCAVALESGVDSSAYRFRHVAFAVRPLMRLLQDRFKEGDVTAFKSSLLTLLKSLQDFKESSLSFKEGNTKTNDTRWTRWIIASVALVSSLLLAVCLKLFLF